VVSLPDAKAGGAAGERDFYFEEFVPVKHHSPQIYADKRR
jgi:hypothetical protein